MSTKSSKTKIENALSLMEAYADRTGLSGKKDASRRYLWTDAFAVQNFLALFYLTNDKKFRDHAFKLIHLVHLHLGKFHPEDNRQGWISGFKDKKAKLHPTAGGLRIGKKLPERKKDESFDERLEWERDGQYFHYITRWINALLSAGNEDSNENYSKWAAELMEAARNFMDPSGGRMYWKMSTDLSRPLIERMGAHDPLEGLLTTYKLLDRFPGKLPEYSFLVNGFEKLCKNENWETDDSLGIGGLLLDAMHLNFLKEHSPESISTEELMSQALVSLDNYDLSSLNDGPNSRLGFRECGMSLGIQVMKGVYEKYHYPEISRSRLQNYITIAEQIENFWLQSSNRESSTWISHKDINEVSLASSLLGDLQPKVFLSLERS